jgi:hypothetical protein
MNSRALKLGISIKKNKKHHRFGKKMMNFGAWVICETWFTGSRDFCELWKHVNHTYHYSRK